MGITEVVFLQGDYAIVKSHYLFSIGFNCYKSVSPGSNTFIKLNKPEHWFTTVEAAKAFLEELKESNYGEINKSKNWR